MTGVPGSQEVEMVLGDSGRKAQTKDMMDAQIPNKAAGPKTPNSRWHTRTREGVPGSQCTPVSDETENQKTETTAMDAKPASRKHKRVGP